MTEQQRQWIFVANWAKKKALNPHFHWVWEMGCREFEKLKQENSNGTSETPRNV